MCLRLLLALTTDAYFDEAYYWTWSKRLAFGYFDHPPLIAWVIALLGIRGAALTCGMLALAVIHLLTRTVLRDAERAWAATALASITPGLFLAGIVATPDAPLVVAWGLWLWAMVRARPIGAGVGGGLALLAKYAAVMAAPVTVVWAALERRLPRWTWLGAVIAIAVFGPCIAWNATHGWVSFRFQLHHGLGGEGGLASLAEYVGGQLLMGGPVLLVLALIWAFRGPGEHRLLRMAFLVPLCGFALAALRTRGESNWPLVAYVGAVVGVASLSRRARWAAAVPSLLICAAAVLHVSFGVMARENDVPLERMQGWSSLRALQHEPQQVVFGPTYQLASQIAYYGGKQVDVIGGGRLSQFDLWPRQEVADGGDALWVSEQIDPPPTLAAAFTRVEGPRTIQATRFGRVLHRFDVWTLKGRIPGKPLRESIPPDQGGR